MHSEGRDLNSAAEEDPGSSVFGVTLDFVQLVCQAFGEQVLCLSLAFSDVVPCE